MKTGKHSRQVERTRRVLSDAFIELILEQHYDAITVQDIIERANVGRSTFYVHFRDKEDLLFSEVERLIDALGRQATHQQHGDALFPSLGLLRHVNERQDLYKALVRGRGADLFFNYGQESLGQRIERRLGDLLLGKPEPTVPLPVLSHFLTGAFLTLVRWWLDNKMAFSPERMDEMFWRMASPSVSAALGHSPES